MKRFLWISLCALLFLTAAGNFFISKIRLDHAFNKTRAQLISIALSGAHLVSAEEVFDVPLEQKSEWTPEYQVIYQKLVKIKEANPSVKYVYVMTTTNQPGIMQYVVDADPVPQIITAKSPSSLPGDRYDARQLPELLDAFKGANADKKITTDDWGTFISGYAPIYDASGNAIAILGVDTDASFILGRQKSVKLRGNILLFTGLLLIISLATLKR